MRSSVIGGLLAPAIFIGLSLTAAAREDVDSEGVWRLRLGAGAIREPDFEGSKTTSTVPTVAVDARYRTENWGTFLLNTDDSGLVWAIIDRPDYAFGPAVGYDEGRSDRHKRNFSRPGSPRLRGLGSIDATWEYGMFGSVVAPGDIPITLIVRKAPPNAGHEGTHVDLTADLAIDVTDKLTATLSPGLSWASDPYMRSYFGVDAEQSARSGKRRYQAQAGVYRYSLQFNVDYRLTKHWFMAVDYTLSRLGGDADKSPIVERETQQSLGLSIGYQFEP